MSQENLETLQKWWDIWMQGDPGDLGDLSLADAKVVYEDEILPDHAGEVYRGHEGLRRSWARFAEPWESFEVQLEWARDAGDAVVSCHRLQARGTASGVEVDVRFAYLWRFREGKIVYVKSFSDPAEALEAAGLSE